MKKLVIDIKPPAKKVKSAVQKQEILPNILTSQETRKTEIAEPKQYSRKKRKIFLPLGSAFAAIVLLFIIISVVGFLELKDTVAKSAPQIYQKFEQGRSALQNFETEKAREFFYGANQEIKAIKSNADKYGFFKISELWSQIIPKIKAIPEAFNNLALFGEATLNLAGNMEELKNHGFKWAVGQQGELLSANLKKSKNNLAEIRSAVENLNGQFAELDYPAADNFIQNDFLNQTLSLTKMEGVLESLANLLSTTEEKRLILLFQNPSELRPSGGFAGSFADLALNKNGIQGIKVWDIYDPDGQLKLNILPPMELQGITPRWGARDANWFFDFPTSAKKIISFLEKSLIYEERGITFEGLIAINVNVVETILRTIGEIELPEYALKLTPENFLSEVQKEVEVGKDKKAGEPKRILKILTPIIFEKLSGLNDSEKAVIFKNLKKHFDKKDIMIFSRDFSIQNFLKELNLSGSVYDFSEKETGEYLAVVSANIAGGKTDAYLTEKIKLSSKIALTGQADNFLTILRTHGGDKAIDPWYRKDNQSRLKIFTLQGSKLIYIDGHDRKKISPPTALADKSNFLKDPELASLENTLVPREEFGIDELTESQKTVFASWLTVPAGDTKKLELQYLNPRKLKLGANAIPYKFVFEKQSGSRVSLDFFLETPPGYLFQETNSRFFNYLNNDPNSREIIDLTLVKDPSANQR